MSDGLRLRLLKPARLYFKRRRQLRHLLETHLPQRVLLSRKPPVQGVPSIGVYSIYSHPEQSWAGGIDFLANRIFSVICNGTGVNIRHWQKQILKGHLLWESWHHFGHKIDGHSVCKDKNICSFHEGCKVSRFCGNADHIRTKGY